MKKLILFVAMIIATITASAEIVNIQTSGVTKVANNQQSQCSGNYSFSVDAERALLMINCHSQGNYNCFTQTGTYQIKHVETVKDNAMGTAYAFLISKNNIDYVLTITDQMASFSRSGQTASLCWHFHIAS